MEGMVLSTGAFTVQKGRQKETHLILLCLSLWAWAAAHGGMAAPWVRSEGRVWNQVPRLYLTAPLRTHEIDVAILSTVPTA